MNKNDSSSLPSSVAKTLEKIEYYYKDIILWLAHMYDPKSGGFYMTSSGMRDPNMEPAIEMTCWGIKILKGYTKALDTMPSDFREGIISFINDRQDPRSGMYIDKQGPANPRETARNQAAALDTLAVLGAKTRYTHPRSTESATEITPVMPEYMATPETYISWIKSWNWDTGSWTAGDQTQSSLQYVNILESARREEYKQKLFAWLEERQQENGFWSPNFDFNAASGAFKMGLVYESYGMRLPNYDKIIDSIFECYKVSKTSNPFFVRNPISVLYQMSKYSPEVKSKIRQGLLDNIDTVVSSFGEFLCPDGAFSAKKERSMLSFGGVVGSHEQNEGDIDATLMMLIARKTLYAIFDAKAPDLDTTDFWSWIYGKKPMPALGTY